MRRADGTVRRWTLLCGAALGLAAFAYFLAWPPTLNGADESFTLYGAKRVWHGDALYRDFFDFIAPGSLYLYALAYAIGGVSITTARVTTALLHAVTVVCTYALALQVASLAEAVLAALLVVAVCVPAWSMASHHWIATALGLATAAVLLADRWRDSTRGRPAVAGALAGVLVSSHQSRGLGLILWLAIVVPTLALAAGGGDRWRRVVRELAWTALGGAVACLAILGWAVWHASVAELVYATHTWVLSNYRSYHHVGSMWWAAAGGYLAPRMTAYTWWPLLRAEPFVLGIEGLLLPWTIARRGFAAARTRLALLLLALLAVSSILYFPDFIHVAFITPYVLVVAAGLVYRARTSLRVLRTRWATIALGAAWLVATGAVLAKVRANLELAWQDNAVRFETAFGTLAGPAYLEEIARDLRARLQVDPARPAHLFAYPTDAWLYLVLPADNPTPFALLKPAYSTPAQIEQAKARLLADPQATILVNLLIAGANDPFVAWIAEHYHDDAGVGPHTPEGIYAYRLFVPKRPASAGRD